MTENLKHFKELLIICLISIVDKGMGKWGHVHIVDGNVKWYFFRGQLGKSYPGKF